MCLFIQILNEATPDGRCRLLLQMASTGGQSLSLSSNVPLLNYQPGLYQQATINIPGLTQQGVPLQTRPTQLCAQGEPFQQTLIVCPPTIQGEGRTMGPTVGDELAALSELLKSSVHFFLWQACKPPTRPPATR